MKMVQQRVVLFLLERVSISAMLLLQMCTIVLPLWRPQNIIGRVSTQQCTVFVMLKPTAIANTTAAKIPYYRHLQFIVPG